MLERLYARQCVVVLVRHDPESPKDFSLGQNGDQIYVGLAHETGEDANSCAGRDQFMLRIDTRAAQELASSPVSWARPT